MTISTIGSKPSKAQIADAVNKASQVEEVTAYTTKYVSDAGKTTFGSYEPLRNQGEHYGALSGAMTAACIITAGMAKITPAGRIEPIANPVVQWDLIQELLSPTAFKKWAGKLANSKHGALFTPKGLTAEGNTFINNRLVGSGPAFNTTKELVDAFLVAMGTGKNVKFKGVKGITMHKRTAKKASQ